MTVGAVRHEGAAPAALSGNSERRTVRGLPGYMLPTTANAMAAKADHKSKLKAIARISALRAGHLAEGESLFGSLR